MDAGFEDRRKGLQLFDGLLALKGSLPGSEGFVVVVMEKPEGGYRVDRFLLHLPPFMSASSFPAATLERVQAEVSRLVEEGLGCVFGRHLVFSNLDELRFSLPWKAGEMEKTLEWFYADCFGPDALEMDRARVVQETLEEGLEPAAGEIRSPRRL